MGVGFNSNDGNLPTVSTDSNNDSKDMTPSSRPTWNLALVLTEPLNFDCWVKDQTPMQILLRPLRDQQDTKNSTAIDLNWKILYFIPLTAI